jgi:hypothetical protein
LIDGSELFTVRDLREGVGLCRVIDVLGSHEPTIPPTQREAVILRARNPWRTAAQAGVPGRFTGEIR